MNRTLKLVTVVLAFSLFSIPIPQVGAQGLQAVYIYSTDLSSAQSFESLLEANGVAVDLVNKSVAATWDYAGYGLIIIGPETGTFGQWDPNVAVTAINDTNLPILGLYEGGASFFSKLNLYINWGQGAWTSETSIYVFDVTHPIFNYPKKINVPSDRIIQLYETSTSTHVIYLSSPIEDVYPLGRSNASTQHYPLIQEKWRYMLWGHRNPPANMTQTGEDLFVNTALWLLTWIVPEFQTLPPILLTMALVTIVAIVATKKIKWRPQR